MSGGTLVHVAVAVIQADDDVLIAKRKQHVHQGGLWEFPGGKVERGESVEAALAREIAEEIGIRIEAAEPLIQVCHRYPEQQVLLDTWKVTAYRGNPHGREAQPIAWVPVSGLGHYHFPEANQPIINAIRLPDRYLITPKAVNTSGFLHSLEKSLARGVKLVQLRTDDNDDSELDAVLPAVSRIVRNANASLMLNSRFAVRLEQQALFDGIHLTGRHLYDAHYLQEIRRCHPNKLLSASCHNQDDILQANRLKLDFVVLSPVRLTHSHPEAVPLGWHNFRDLVSKAQLPVYALGGVSESDIGTARQSGGHGIAAISALWQTSGHHSVGK